MKVNMQYQEHYPISIAEKLVCIDDRFTLPVIVFKADFCINKLIKWIFRKQKKINRVI